MQVSAGRLVSPADVLQEKRFLRALVSGLGHSPANKRVQINAAEQVVLKLLKPTEAIGPRTSRFRR
jgi:hypothetical protein